MSDTKIETPDALKAEARKYQRLYEEELAKHGRADGAYIELSIPGNSQPVRVNRSDDPILTQWRTKGETVYYCEWKGGTLVTGFSRGAEACWTLLRKYERENPTPAAKAPEPTKPEKVLAGAGS